MTGLRTRFPCLIPALLSTVAAAVVGVGCQSTRPSPPPATFTPSGGKTYAGQLQYVGPQRSFVGDFIARVSGADFQLSVSKGPGIPVFNVQESGGGTVARIETPNRTWRGHPRFAPRQARSWLALDDVLAGRPVQDGRVTRAGNRVAVEFAATGERFLFQFGR